MGSRNAISRKAWQRAVNVLLWYPDNVMERVTLTEELLHGERKGTGRSSLVSDPTASAAIRLAADRRLNALEHEIEAVEIAVDALPDDQRIIIRKRFWDIQKGAGIYRKPRQYDFLQDMGFSERTMRRVCRKTILCVASLLGER